MENDFQMIPESTIGVGNRFCFVDATYQDLPLTLAFVRAAATPGHHHLISSREVLSIIDNDCPIEDLPTAVRKWWTGNVRRGN